MKFRDQLVTIIDDGGCVSEPCQTSQGVRPTSFLVHVTVQRLNRVRYRLLKGGAGECLPNPSRGPALLRAPDWALRPGQNSAE